MRTRRFSRTLLPVLTLGVLVAPTLGQDDAEALWWTRVTDEEAIEAISKFLHVEAEAVSVERVGEGRAHAPPSRRGFRVRHAVPFESPWWGPTEEDGKMESSFSLERLRDTGQAYVEWVNWSSDEPAGEAVALEEVPARARLFLEAMCPYFHDGLEMTHFQGFPIEGSSSGMTHWGYRTETTRLNVGVSIYLANGRASYTCRNITGIKTPTVTRDEAVEVADREWLSKCEGQELVVGYVSWSPESDLSPTWGPVWRVEFREGPAEASLTEQRELSHWSVYIDGLTGEVVKADPLPAPLAGE